MKKSDMDKVELVKRLDWYEKRYGGYIEKRGLNNWRNLFRKPNNYEWTILFMLLMSGFIAWSYQVDTAKCRAVLEDIDSICLAVNEKPIFQNNKGPLNITNFTFKLTAENELPPPNE